jgi:hypothetical protein
VKFLDMFKDDYTKQWSFARISAALVILYWFLFAVVIGVTERKLIDIPSGWLAYAMAAYGLNKAASTLNTVLGKGG